MKRPAFQFYPADWRKDTELQSCSISARGLWHEMMCVMHECEPYGHLAVNGLAMSDAQASRLCGVDLKEYRKLLVELFAAGVPSRTMEGIIYSRRMVRDEQLRNTRAACGQLGGNPKLLGEKVNQNEPPWKNKVNQIPTPSSSSSSSSSFDEVRSELQAPQPSPIQGKSGHKNGHESQTLKASMRWLVDESACKAKLADLGMKANAGESWESVRQRIADRLGKDERERAENA